MTRTARNWEQRIFEPGTTFLIRDQGPGFQVSNNRRAAAYAGDVAGSMILAPLLASTATQIGAGLYNAAVPEALNIPAEGLANLAALGAMGYGAYKGIARFHNAGGWPGFMGKFGKFADQATIATPGPRPGPDAGPMPVSGPGPQGPVPGGTPPIYPGEIIIEDGNPLPPVFTGIPIAVAPPVATKAARSEVPTVPTAVAPVQAMPATTAIVPSKAARNTEPMVITVPAQQVPEPTIQDLAALAMQEEAKRRAKVQMILDAPLSQIPTSPEPVSIPRAAGQLTLASLHNNPYSSDYLNSW